MRTEKQTLRVKNILISQPEPADYAKSPYKSVADKFGLKLTFKKLFYVEGIGAVEFRKQRINILDYSAVVLTSRNAVDHYFRMAREMRVTIPISMKFICNSESVAYYIQTYMQFRKRKIFFGKQTTADLMEVVAKHKEETFLFPCSEDSNSEVPAAFAKAKIPLKVAPMYKSVPARVARELSISDFDMILMFSPIGVKSLYENYPTFRQGKTLIGVHGRTVADAAVQAGLKVNLFAPTPHSQSMSDALGEFLADLNKHGGDMSKIDPCFEYNPELLKEAEKVKAKTTGKHSEADGKDKSSAKTLEKIAANKAAAQKAMEELARKRSEASKKAAATLKAKREAERKAAEELARKRSLAAKKAAATLKAKREAERKAAEELARKRSLAAKKAAATLKAKREAEKKTVATRKTKAKSAPAKVERVSTRSKKSATSKKKR